MASTHIEDSSIELLTIKDITRVLKISTGTARKLFMRKINPIPSTVVGGRLRRFPKDKFKLWLDTQGQ